MRRLALPVALALCALAVGCSVHDVHRDALPAVDLLSTFSPAGDAPLPDRWWRHMGDEALTRLIRSALARNYDLRQAAARLAQAEQIAVQAGAPLWPWLSGEGFAQRSRTVVPLDSSKPQMESTDNLFGVALAASYEVDLWRRIRNRHDAAWLDVIASREDLNAFAIILAARVADTWYALVEQHAQLNLLAEQIETSRTFLDLTELRFGQGQASALDVYQQRTQLADVRGQVPGVRARLEVLQHQLAVLLGRSAQSAAVPRGDMLPELPPLPDAGLPVYLLRRRPDLRAAHARLRAADHRIGVAVAERLPALRLTARGSFQSQRAGDLFNNWLWTLAGNLTQPIFEGGRLKAEVVRRRAVWTEFHNRYSAVTLAAIGEVESALAQERRQRETIVELEMQVDLAEKQLKQARERYANGLIEFLPVLTALQGLQARQRRLLSARRQLVAFRIQLYRALGGTWPREIDAGQLITIGPDGGSR